MLGIVAGKHQKDNYALLVSCSGTCKARFVGILHLALCSSRGFQAQMPCRQVRRLVCIKARMNQRDSFCGEKVVVVPVVLQRLIPTVLLTVEIPQLQFSNEVIDVPVVHVVQVLPSRSPVVCNDRCPGYVPQLQLIYTPRSCSLCWVVDVPIVRSCRSFTSLSWCRCRFPWSRLRYSPVADKVIDVPVVQVLRDPQVPSWRRQSSSHVYTRC